MFINRVLEKDIIQFIQFHISWIRSTKALIKRPRFFTSEKPLILVTLIFYWKSFPIMDFEEYLILALVWKLSKRLQFTYINGVKLNLNTMFTGVPQGSVLRPLLFLVLINDLSNVSNELLLLLFANDTTFQI